MRRLWRYGHRQGGLLLTSSKDLIHLMVSSELWTSTNYIVHLVIPAHLVTGLCQYATGYPDKMITIQTVNIPEFVQLIAPGSSIRFHFWHCSVLYHVEGPNLIGLVSGSFRLKQVSLVYHIALTLNGYNVCTFFRFCWPWSALQRNGSQRLGISPWHGPLTTFIAHRLVNCRLSLTATWRPDDLSATVYI